MDHPQHRTVNIMFDDAVNNNNRNRNNRLLIIVDNFSMAKTWLDLVFIINVAEDLILPTRVPHIADLTQWRPHIPN